MLYVYVLFVFPDVRLNSVIRCHPADCPAVACSHPATPFGHCCPTCEHCEFTRRLYRQGQHFPHHHDSCQMCHCQNGTVHCDTVLCDPLPCPFPTSMAGACCPVCPSTPTCSTAAPTADQECQRCGCNAAGVLRCRGESCPDAPCPNPRLGLCCEECEGCSYGDKNYPDSVTFSDPHNPCRECHCKGGAVTCHNAHCGHAPTCSGSSHSPSSPCQDVQDCEYKGGMYAEGEVFPDPDDPCLECSCSDHQVACEAGACPGCLQDPLRPPCSLQNTECYFYDDMHDSGSVFKHPLNQCEVCSCQNGQVTCFEEHCPAALCSHPVPGQCCSGCDQGCWVAGSKVAEGATFPDPSDHCLLCQCRRGNFSCEQKECQELSCTHPAVDGCCPVCGDCFFEMDRLLNKQTTARGTCEECTCADGSVTCAPKRCSPVQCDNPVVIDCCPVCESGCSLGGHEYREGDPVSSSESACEVCRCLNGSIMCVPKICPSVQCSHPVLRQCCPVCDSGCSLEGQSYSDGDSVTFEDKPCEACRCGNGSIVCQPENCLAVPCSHAILRGCCPVCDSGCFYGGNVYSLGEKVPHDTQEPCEECVCEGGSVTCKVKVCPSVTCSNPVVKECCPVCDSGCKLGFEILGEAEEVPDPSQTCHSCRCSNGSVTCGPTRCPVVHCSDPVLKECCPVCHMGCNFGSETLREGEEVPDPARTCEVCSCSNGSVVCGPTSCPLVHCSDPVLKDCCPVCHLGCFYEGQTYAFGAEFDHPKDPCSECACMDGSVSCAEKPCDPVTCQQPIRAEGECCQTCPQMCLYAGVEREQGSVFLHEIDVCQECTCMDGDVDCQPMDCPLANCSHPAVGGCCPECHDCSFDGTTYAHNATFRSLLEPCESCICLDGHVTCEGPACSASCSHPVPDTCCGNCSDCFFEGVILSNRLQFRPDPCRNCTCEEGSVHCASESCPELECRLRTLISDACCETCTGCVHEGTEHAHNETWVTNFDPCVTCLCEGGSVSCRNTVCPVECLEPVPVPGKCCPICPVCEMDNQTYKSGEKFSPPSRPCDACTCDSGHVFCLRHECPALIGCPEESVRAPATGQCCPSCSAGFSTSCTRDQIGQLVYPNQRDPCFSCQCSEDYMWICSKEFCPHLDCPASDIVRNETECCPKCGVCIAEDNIVHLHEDNWFAGNDSCINCSCDYGAVTCSQIICPVLNCGIDEIEFITNGQCCAKCSAPTALTCEYEGAMYNSGDTWKVDPCTTCLCTQGSMHCVHERCLPLRCPSDHMPTVAPGHCCPRCTPHPARCVAFGDPHYRSFDGLAFSFQGTCRYVLAADCDGQRFSVAVQNSDRGLPGVSWTQRVWLLLQDAQLDLRPGPAAYIKGKAVETLPHFEEPSFYIEKTGNSLLVNTDVGVQVLWNGEGYVEVTVSGEYEGKTCGLCGNFNHFAEDDLRLPNNQTASSDAQFGNSWKYGEKQPAGCRDADDIDPCSKGGYRVRKIANTKCSVLKQAPFSACHPLVPPEPYFGACVHDVCACAEREGCLCDVLAAYSARCAHAGLVLRWREGTPCGIECNEEEGLVFDECGPPCFRTCANRGLSVAEMAAQCFKPCVPGCQCSADKLLHNGRCIPPSLCPS